LEAIGSTFETFDRLGAFHGVQLRHPFFDKRLVEFCVSLPLELKVNNGMTRWVLREAMRGTLPESIRERRDKSNLGPSFVRRLGAEADELRRITSSSYRGDFLDEEEVSRRIEKFIISPSQGDAMALYRVACFKVWLLQNDLT
jgi:asparagine synthase (glutamine-hydrolysing)